MYYESGIDDILKRPIATEPPSEILRKRIKQLTEEEAGLLLAMVGTLIGSRTKPVWKTELRDEVLGSRDWIVRGRGEILIDKVRKVVVCRGREVHLPPKAFDLLIVLADADGAPVPKSKLIELLHPQSGAGRKGEPRALSQNVLDLRKRIELNRRKPRLIKTHHRYGFSLSR